MQLNIEKTPLDHLHAVNKYPWGICCDFRAQEVCTKQLSLVLCNKPVLTKWLLKEAQRKFKASCWGCWIDSYFPSYFLFLLSLLSGWVLTLLDEWGWCFSFCPLKNWEFSKVNISFFSFLSSVICTDLLLQVFSSDFRAFRCLSSGLWWLLCSLFV